MTLFVKVIQPRSMATREGDKAQMEFERWGDDALAWIPSAVTHLPIFTSCRG